jgi:hypothetical protein
MNTATEFSAAGASSAPASSKKTISDKRHARERRQAHDEDQNVVRFHVFRLHGQLRGMRR